MHHHVHYLFPPLTMGLGVMIAVLKTLQLVVFPTLLPSLAGSPHPGLDIYNTASPAGGLRIALGVYLFGMILWRLVNIYRIWRGPAAQHHVQ